MGTLSEVINNQSGHLDLSNQSGNLGPQSVSVSNLSSYMLNHNGNIGNVSFQSQHSAFSGNVVGSGGVYYAPFRMVPSVLATNQPDLNASLLQEPYPSPAVLRPGNKPSQSIPQAAQPEQAAAEQKSTPSKKSSSPRSAPTKTTPSSLRRDVSLSAQKRRNSVPKSSYSPTPQKVGPRRVSPRHESPLQRRAKSESSPVRSRPEASPSRYPSVSTASVQIINQYLPGLILFCYTFYCCCFFGKDMINSRKFECMYSVASRYDSNVQSTLD